MNLDGRRESSNVEDRRVKQVPDTCSTKKPPLFGGGWGRLLERSMPHT